ncbi:hypothetical protein [Shewanella sp. NFH-SH190041]|uniref:hypothetical protein n=1 Tax=Shewanella sp. NFH-SH190041 TaxID=2950245 RepID=UPI0021C3A77C|nr:hypothetical protein [Shewanella sp. NFH-SH190041]
MPISLQHRLLSLFTVLAILLQGMVLSGQVIAQPDSAPLSHITASLSSSHPCDTDHLSSPIAEMDCCQTPASAPHCCDGNNGCSEDCGHCMTISVTGTLLSDNYWPERFPSEAAVSTKLPHFHSVSLSQALRPPIA